MENFDIVIKTIIFYLVLIILMRLLGKREVGEISVFDLVVVLMVADIATMAITDRWHLVLPSIFSLFALLFLQKIFAYISLYYPKVRKVIDYTPSVIIYDGKLNLKEMKKQKYTIDDLVTQSREAGVMDLQEIRMAILESTGQLSIFKKEVYLKQILPVIVSGSYVDDNINILEIKKELITDYLKEKKLMLEEVKYLSSDGYNFYMIDSL